MMNAKKLILLAAVAACGYAFGASKAATEAWVKAYVGGLNGGTNGVISVDAGSGRKLAATYELFTEPAIIVTNSVNVVITNGMRFAWNGYGAYTNAPAAKVITSTTSNLVYGASASVVTNGMDRFFGAQGGAFSVLRCAITKTEAKVLKGE